MENNIWPMKLKTLDYNVWDIKIKSEDTNLNIERKMFFDKIFSKEDIKNLIGNKYKNSGEIEFSIKISEEKKYER